ncbi:putative leucine-rich repeat domain, L domain-containing protein [Medicago truncatula]|uniref:Putative leucine-rich repeat domain, L domain-containing protein n=1 Tax=Medicago truncatula TaxID=3880 RepID=A0A396IQ61_MEDTR|nr:LRR repeats and ubiquitin-like domain-containing protein At2g30105 [Medicago truncatula]RHN67732.1 putative leucine-rich repeat domain, L domain-containing protein [Medicago truncatula]
MNTLSHIDLPQENHIELRIVQKTLKMEIDGGTTNSNATTITISVKFSGSTIPISISPQSTIKELKSLLLPATNVLPRGQKLIFKGKVLEDSVTVAASNLSNGSKVMLMASQGLYQGDGPVLKRAQAVPKKDSHSSSSNDVKKIPVKNRLERWKATGVVALSECNLEAIPDEVWICGSSARVLHCNDNLLKKVPVEISQLTRLDKLFINSNNLLDESINWEALSNLKYLTVLSLNQNRLTTLPSVLGLITSLRELHVSNNQLAGLPDEIGHLTKLEVLKANNNRMSKISEFIGKCHSLVEVDFSSNFLSELPETFSSFSNLKALHLSNNGMKSLPSKLFKTCLQLSTLDLHNTEITIDILREFEGWDSFDERRRSKHQKQIEFRVGVSRDFDEGADKN